MCKFAIQKITKEQENESTDAPNHGKNSYKGNWFQKPEPYIYRECGLYLFI
jgi:hypothetical protein